MATPELINSISALSRKIDRLLERYASLQMKVKSLEEENFLLRKEKEDADERLEQAGKEIEFLKLSHRLADSPEALVSARQNVAGLIRTIDSCIRMLKED